MNDTLKMYGSIGSEIMNRYFVVAMCFKRQPRWRRLQTINTEMGRGQHTEVGRGATYKDVGGEQHTKMWGGEQHTKMWGGEQHTKMWGGEQHTKMWGGGLTYKKVGIGLKYRGGY